MNTHALEDGLDSGNTLPKKSVVRGLISGTALAIAAINTPTHAGPLTFEQVSGDSYTAYVDYYGPGTGLDGAIMPTLSLQDATTGVVYTTRGYLAPIGSFSEGTRDFIAYYTGPSGEELSLSADFTSMRQINTDLIAISTSNGGEFGIQYGGGNFNFTSGGYSATLTRDVMVAAPVPEPETYALMGIGLAGVALAKRRKDKKDAAAKAKASGEALPPADIQTA